MNEIDFLINEFFKKNSFDSDELNELKNSIINKVGFKKYKPYENFINLKLLKFELKDNKQNSNFLNNEEKFKTSGVVKKIEDVNSNCTLYKNNSKYVGKTIIEISKLLNIKAYIIKNIFNKSNISVNDDTVLTIDLFPIIEHYVKKRKSILKSINKKEEYLNKRTNKKREDKSLSINNSVYDKLQNSTGIIKLIYIRSK